MIGLLHDLRHAIRGLRKSPGFTLAAVATFALGIGTNTAVFSVIDAVLLRPLTYADSDRLVVVHETVPQLGRMPVGVSEFTEWRRMSQAFEELALIDAESMLLTGAGEPDRLEAARVSATLFPMLGVQPALGRPFSPDEEIVGRHRVVLLSDRLWRSGFGADATIIGRAITLDDERYVVIGVLPPDFLFPRLEQLFAMGLAGGRPEVWLPFAIRDVERTENSFAAVGKLKRGVSAGQARDELSAIQHRLAEQIPNPPQLGAEVISLQEQMTGASRDALVLLWVAIAVVLVIACVNIANLLLVRAAVRGPEFAVRGALGASRRDLLRHALVDSFTLAILGGAGGVLVAVWLLPLFLRLAPATVPRLDEVSIDVRAWLFATLLTSATALLVGLLPARRAAGANLLGSLRTGTRNGTTSRRDRAVRSAMVSAQAALTVACLAVGGLVLQSLLNVLRVEPGFKPDQVLAIELGVSPARYQSRDARAALARELVRQVSAQPGVVATGVVNRMPFSGISMNSVLAVEGTENAAIPFVERPLADIRSVDAGYFRALGISVLEGTLFVEALNDRPVAVISTAMARRAWPGVSPIGKRFRLSAQPDRLVEVVGVVENVRNMGLESPAPLTVYLPYWQFFAGGTSLAVKTTSDPGAAAAGLRTAVSVIDPDISIESVRTMGNVMSDSVAARRFQATLLMLFGMAAVSLAGVGVFGVMSYAVADRSKELAIRLALGSSPRSLQQIVLGSALRLVGTGVLIGLPMAVAAGFALRSLLFGVKPYSGIVLAFASGVVILVAMIAGAIPALRAARVDPLVALRYE